MPAAESWMPQSPSDTERLVEALADPRCYPHPVDAVRVIETHISYVLLTGRHAYKLKKPLALDFLDFSTLAARRRCCEEELRLNRRTAPELYLGVVPIAGSLAQPRVAGAGEPIEYAVQMRQFDPEALFARLAEREQLQPEQIDALASALAEFHAQIAVAAPESPWGAPEAVIAAARASFEQVLALVREPELRARVTRLAEWSATQHARLAPRFEARKRDGFVRECHGDLHLANVALIDGEPRLFDCIEFDPQLRWIDVQSEIAFAFMDLHRHGCSALAWRFLNAYLEHTGDYAGVPLLACYAVYRAMVRALVALLRGSQQAGGEAEGRASAALIRHLELAERLARRHVPLLVITTGLSGSGKSTVAAALAEALGALRIRSDVERKRLQGLVAGARSGSGVASGLYSERASRATYDRLAALARTLLVAGSDVIVDAAFLERGERERFAGVASAAGARFRILACEAPLAVLRARVIGRSRSGRDASEADLAVLEHQRESAAPLADHEWDSAIELRTDVSLQGIEASARALAGALL